MFHRQVAPVELEPGEGSVPVYQLERRVEAVPEEGGAEDGVKGDDRGPGFAEGRDVESGMEREGELLEVEARGGGEEGVEKHPLLHGGEGVEVLEGMAGRKKPVEGRLGEASKGEVGGGVAESVRGEALGDEGAKGGEEALGEGVDGGL